MIVSGVCVCNRVIVSSFSASSLTPPPRSADDKENNFYSSDSDYDDEEPKKFHIQIRPVCNRSDSTANELELKATVGTLTLPPNPGVSAGGGAKPGEHFKINICNVALLYCSYPDIWHFMYLFICVN